MPSRPMYVLAPSLNSSLPKHSPFSAASSWPSCCPYITLSASRSLRDAGVPPTCRNTRASRSAVRDLISSSRLYSAVMYLCSCSRSASVRSSPDNRAPFARFKKCPYSLVAYASTVDVAAAGGQGRRLGLQARVGAPRTESDAGARLRVPVEDHRVVFVADEDLGPRLRAGVCQRLLDAKSRQPVGEVADRLVVAEVGLLYPPARLGAHDPERVLADPAQLEVRAGHGLWPDHEPGRLRFRRSLPRFGDDRRQRERQIAQALARGGRDAPGFQAPGLQVRGDDLGEVPAFRYVDLVEYHDPR